MRYWNYNANAVSRGLKVGHRVTATADPKPHLTNPHPKTIPNRSPDITLSLTQDPKPNRN